MEPRRPGKGAPPPEGRRFIPGTPYPTSSFHREPVTRRNATGPIRNKRPREYGGSSTSRRVLGGGAGGQEQTTVKAAHILQGIDPTDHVAPQQDPTTKTESYDAGPGEGVVGMASIDDITLWKDRAAQFIRSSAGITGSPDVWVGKRPLGEGGFGLAGLWEKIDSAGNVVDVGFFPLAADNR